MDSRFQFYLLLISVQFFLVTAEIDGRDLAALSALKNSWSNIPHSWAGMDPCASWEGIQCTGSRVTSITLASMGVSGPLSDDIPQLSELEILDLSYNKGLTGPLPASIGNLKKLTSLILIGCSFNGRIPDAIGSLQMLTTLSLNSNAFTGPIPPSIGALSDLYWLDITDNKLSGTIPVSNGTTPGLDMLLNAGHFHCGKNQLEGQIPPRLFSSKMTLIHVLFDSNQLSGEIPETLGLVTNLTALRLDRNSFSGTVPSNLNDLKNVQELFLSNNKLTGPFPNLQGMDALRHVDLSNNTFNLTDFPPWFSTFEYLTTLVMENTSLQGQINATLFGLPHLQTVELKNNQINGTLDIGSTPSSELQLIDLQNNSIAAVTERPRVRVEPILVGNPFCDSEQETEIYCIIQKSNSSSYSTPPNNCSPITCNSNQVSSVNCTCAYPYTGTLSFSAPSFSDLGNSRIYKSLENILLASCQSNQLPVDSVSLSNPHKYAEKYVVLNFSFFPSGQDHFNRTGITRIGLVLSMQNFNHSDNIGPISFIGDPYEYFSGSMEHKKSSSTGLIIGAAVGGCVLLLLTLIAGTYAYRQKKRAETADKQNNPFASWDPNKSSGDIPQLKGARFFPLEELKKYTNNFSEANAVGSGGFGKVYRGTLPNGRLLAIKRAQQGSLQGNLEFKTEIELLSRIHHKNVVSLLGFCFEEAEQILVYEYIPNGTLKQSLSGKSGIRLDWMRRLRIALGAARGLQYLHELADPPIIHRDIKSNNILLDERLNAKVADFGLSKLISDTGKDHVSTQVKGTMGYLDPEYYMTHILTEKSDVYSFGVLMLELITARQPIEKGKYIVREVQQRMDETKALYNLQDILDPKLFCTELKGMEKFVDLAMSCVQESATKRPTMGEVLKEIENIVKITGLNPNADSSSTSATYDATNHPYTDESLFNYSGVFLPPKVEPH
ncbi:Non-specific serine/threonine protein kinase [Bertholletia excelsa]